MHFDIEKIVQDALELPPPLRAFVAEKLLESLDSDPQEPLSSAWKAEVRRRCAEIDNGVAQLRDSEVVFAKAVKSLS